MTVVTLPNKGTNERFIQISFFVNDEKRKTKDEMNPAQISPLSREFEFPTLTVNNLFEFSAQGRDLVLFWQWDQSQNTF